MAGSQKWLSATYFEWKTKTWSRREGRKRGRMPGGLGHLTITMSPVSEFARSVTEECPSASGGWPLGLFAGLLPLQSKNQVDKRKTAQTLMSSLLVYRKRLSPQGVQPPPVQQQTASLKWSVQSQFYYGLMTLHSGTLFVFLTALANKSQVKSARYSTD